VQGVQKEKRKGATVIMGENVTLPTRREKGIARLRKRDRCHRVLAKGSGSQKKKGGHVRGGGKGKGTPLPVGNRGVAVLDG